MKHLTPEANAVLARAEQEARRLNHHYVGTEHLLLAIAANSSTHAAQTLLSFNVTDATLSAQIVAIVRSGMTPLPPGTPVPLTPRAKQALSYAADEAATLQQKLVDTEHLLLGLLREPDGVAGQILRALPVDPTLLRQRLLHTRLTQLQIVERAVRPLRATVPRKRKMREELLAHFTTIYEDELARLHGPALALDVAARRFGDPAQLSAELQRALPPTERLAHFCERYFAWRHPESVARYSFRVAANIFVLLAVAWIMIAAFYTTRFGLSDVLWIALRPVTAFLVIFPPGQFLLGLLYIKMRDSLLGAFGQAKSPLKSLALTIPFAAIVLASAFAFFAIAAADPVSTAYYQQASYAAAILLPFVFLLIARVNGPTEIQDTLWSSLDLAA